VAAIGKPLVWLRGDVRTPPFLHAARVEAGVLLRQLRGDAKLGSAAFATDAGNRCSSAMRNSWQTVSQAIRRRGCFCRVQACTEQDAASVACGPGVVASWRCQATAIQSIACRQDGGFGSPCIGRSSRAVVV